MRGWYDSHPHLFLRTPYDRAGLNIYAQAAAAVGVTAPKDALRSSTLIDGTVWNGADPAAYAASFALKV
jgi:nitrate/nitrite transport system substrate-binding protein